MKPLKILLLLSVIVSALTMFVIIVMGDEIQASDNRSRTCTISEHGIGQNFTVPLHWNLKEVFLTTDAEIGDRRVVTIICNQTI